MRVSDLFFLFALSVIAVALIVMPYLFVNVVLPQCGPWGR
jgi:hypothetical protein